MTRIACLVALVCLACGAAAQAPDASAEALRMEMVFWESVRNSTDPADFRAYLEQYPNGKFASLARNRLAALTPKPAAVPPAAVKPEPGKPAPSTASGALEPGNSWTYRVFGRGSAYRGTQQVTLAAATSGSMVEDILADGITTRVEHRKGFYLVPAGNVTLFSPYLAAFGELRPGAIDIDVLDSRTCNAGWTCQVRGRVMGRERVQIAAGTFEATRVEISQYWQSPAISYASGEVVSRTLTVWYAPEVKRAIKFVGRGGPSRTVDTEFDIELVSFKLD
jgi:hypothetical protein